MWIFRPHGMRDGAIARIAEGTMDPTDGWDPWPVMHEHLDALRESYGINPLTAVPSP